MSSCITSVIHKACYPFIRNNEAIWNDLFLIILDWCAYNLFLISICFVYLFDNCI